MKIQYKVAADFPDYLVGSDGSVWSLKRGKRLGQYLQHGGYLLTALYRHGTRKFVQTHRLVLLTFVGLCPPGNWCRHLNGVRIDNRLANLRWGTPKENHADRVRHGTDPIGNRNRRAKLSESFVTEIRRRYRLGGTSQQSLADEFGVSQGMIGFIVRGRNWTHV